MNPPHIVLITVDHLRADFMGCAGHPVVRTPHIDFLARRGVRFTNAYSTCPVCIPARATLMTGLEGDSLGCTSYVEGFALPVQATLPRLLGQAGYQTRSVGKMHVYPERCHYGFESMLLCEEGRLLGIWEGKNRGYDDYEGWLAEQGYAGQAFAHGLANNEYAATPWHLPRRMHPTEWIGNETCKAIKRRDWTRPQFLWASFTAPHPPLTPLLEDLVMYRDVEMPRPVRGDWTDRHSVYHAAALEQYRTLTDRDCELAYRAFFALITQVDRQINRIIGTLREEGMLENTWFIFTSDHGDNMGDHGLWAKSNFLQGSCHIPLIITPPVKGDLDAHVAVGWQPGTTRSAVVGLQDILPTCVALTGEDASAAPCDGRNLLPIVRDSAQTVREELLGEFGLVGNRSFMLTDGEWKYLWYEADGKELLFDIVRDPRELHDLSPEQPDLLRGWRERLAERLGRRAADPVVQAGRLTPAGTGAAGARATADLARTVSDLSPRGLH